MQSCEPCKFPEAMSVSVTFENNALRYTELSCGCKQTLVGADGAQFEIGMPVTIDPTTGIVSPDPTGIAPNFWGISLVSKLSSAADNSVTVIRHGVVSWQDVASAAGLNANDPAVYWPIAVAMRPSGIFLENI